MFTRILSAMCALLAGVTSVFSATIHHRIEFNTSELDHTTINEVAQQEEIPYTPMLEVGKEWRYNVYNRNVYAPHDFNDSHATLRLDESVMIEGHECFPYKIIWHEENEIDYDSNVYLFEEDRKIYITNFHPALRYTSCLFDFTDIENNFRDWGEVNPEWIVYEGIDGKHNAVYLKIDDWISYLLVEGLGYITPTECKSNPERHCYGILTWGFPSFGTTGDGWEPKVYEIARGNGEIIYSFEEGYPGYESTLLSLEETKTDNGDNGEPIIYDLQGRHITGKPAPGIYIINGKKAVIH